MYNVFAWNELCYILHEIFFKTKKIIIFFNFLNFNCVHTQKVEVTLLNWYISRVKSQGKVPTIIIIIIIHTDE